jgi:hypothetical protein
MITLLGLSILVGISCSTPSRIGIHDRFRESEDGSVTDIVTGLQWKIGPDRDFDWYAAQSWIEDLGGDWRMPTIDELEQLYSAGITTDTWGPFDNTGWIVWCLDFTSRDMRYRFCFIPNDAFLDSHTSAPSGQRVFAVLAPRSYGTEA